ncbi:serine hydroxymethyltransferase, partial [Francisella tularensis subsp. holarctica]|nr:serine hydroxymethyltransferase [Francisella tularensis subsp. holarctica]
TVIGMVLGAGGHLPNGSKVNFSGKIYNSSQYGLDENGDLDYEQVAQLAKEHKPTMIIAGVSEFSGISKWQKFRERADSVDAV